MTLYFRFVPHSSEGETIEFPTQGLCNGLPNGSFPGSWRSNQKDDGACQVVVDDAHRNQFQNAVLDVFQTKMIAVQNPPGPFEIKKILAVNTPG